MHRPRPLLAAVCAALVASTLVPALAADAPAVVRSAADLHRFSYPLAGPASALLESDDATFAAFAAKVRHDLDRTLADYRIEDRATRSQLLAVRLALQELAGDTQAGLRTVQALRALEEKPAQKLLAGLLAQARLEAAAEATPASGPAYEAAFRRHLAAAVDSLPWQVVQDGIRGAFGRSLTLSRGATVGGVMTEIDPAAATSKSLDASQAWALVGARLVLKKALPVADVQADVLHAYIARHDTPKPDIWAAREVTLGAADGLTPVNVAIWDSGIDLASFPGQVYDDPEPTASGTHGLAFDDQGHPSQDWLYPLTPAQKAAYPGFLEDIRGRLDLQHGVDSPAARRVREQARTLSPEQMHRLFEDQKVLGFYVHGTHCAGIAVRGNPAARLVVARFNDQLPDLPFAPTEAWARQMGTAFRQMGDYFRTRHVRVVNMSWGDDAQEIETWLSKTGGGADPAERKAKAAAIIALWKQAVQQAMRAAPDTLFVVAAGNSDSDVGFIEDVPASLREPNMIAVGAVNQAGGETSFTSHGEQVAVYASGFEVLSTVPGGARVPLSGTSMAAPNVVNLAAKLFALAPSLTPAQAAELIRNGASSAEGGRLRLIDPQRTVALLRARHAAH